MKKCLSLLCLLLSALSSVYGQESQLPYESKIADLGEIQMEYKDFGGEGIPFIWVQDFHNYFEGEYLDTTYNQFFTDLALEARVLAPLKRGYGKSTFTRWGYDVATQAEDLLKFMDILGIEKAILFGRLPANQDMTWIAEHHPERVLGLIYWGNPVLIGGCSNADELAVMENLYAIMAPDFHKDQEKILVMSRSSWRPHFLDDNTVKINIPALQIISEEFNKMSGMRANVESGRVERLAQLQSPDFVEEVGVIREIVQDSIRFSELKKHLVACDPTIAIDEGMKRAFDGNLTRVLEPNFDFSKDEDYLAYFDWLRAQIITFIKNF